MASAMDLVNLVLAIASLVGIFKLIYDWIFKKLPSQRLKILDDNFHDTQRIFTIAVEEGLLTDQITTKDIEEHLHSIRYQQEELRAKVHVATTFSRQFHGWTSGLSSKLTILSNETLEIRARIAALSDAERRRLESSGSRLPQRSLIPPNATSNATQHTAVARRSMNPAFRRLLTTGAPFSSNSLNTLLQASRTPADAQDALRSTIPLAPLPRLSRAAASTEPVASGSASGVDTQQGLQEMTPRNHDAKLLSASSDPSTSGAGPGVAKTSSHPLPTQGGVSATTNSTSSLSINDLLSTIGQLSDTVARLGAAVDARQAVDAQGNEPQSELDVTNNKTHSKAA